MRAYRWELDAEAPLSLRKMLEKHDNPRIGTRGARFKCITRDKILRDEVSVPLELVLLQVASDWWTDQLARYGSRTEHIVFEHCIEPRIGLNVVLYVCLNESQRTKGFPYRCNVINFGMQVRKS